MMLVTRLNRRILLIVGVVVGFVAIVLGSIYVYASGTGKGKIEYATDGNPYWTYKVSYTEEDGDEYVEFYKINSSGKAELRGIIK